MDPISDMLTAINNAIAVKKQTVIVPFSKMKERILEILKEEGYILNYRRVGKSPQKKLLIDLKYDSDKTPAINKLRKISKPGQRIYISSIEISPVKSGFGVSIISTSQGLMTNKEAKKRNLGGEVICEVW